jgi:hypothetical protein
MLLNPEYLKRTFQQEALPYEEYVRSGTPDQAKRWSEVYEAVSLADSQKELLQSFVRQMNILAVSGIWCGDCVQQCPLLARISEACSVITLRFIDRDAIPELRDNITINAGTRVPVAIFMAEDFALCSVYGDRTISRYRSLARQQLGPACSTGLFLPDNEELHATLADWLNEIERIQLMLRLSTRLRKLHND